MNMEGMDMGGHGDHGGDGAQPTPYVNPAESWPMSYFSHGEHSGSMIAHIALMILAWCFILPTGEIIPLSLYSNVRLTVPINRRHAEYRAITIGTTIPVHLLSLECDCCVDWDYLQWPDSRPLREQRTSQAWLGGDMGRHCPGGNLPRNHPRNLPQRRRIAVQSGRSAV